MPGDPLYPFKQTIEHVQVATAGSLLDKGKAQLDEATTRLTEVQHLAEGGGSSDPATSLLMANTLGDFSSQAHEGTVTLLSSYHQDNEKRAIVDLRDFTTRSVDSLSKLSTQVPPSVLGNVGAAATQMTSDDAVAVAACSDCTAEAPLVLPARLLAIAPTTPPAVSPGLPDTPSVTLPGSTDPSVSIAPSSVGDTTSSIPVVIPPATVTGPPSDSAPSSVDGSVSQPPPDTTTDPTTQPPSSDVPGSTAPPPSTEPTAPPTSVSVPPESAAPSDTTAPLEPSGPSGLTSAPASGLGESSTAPPR
jgi:hypothetical protein